MHDVRTESMDRGKIFASFGYIKNIIEDKISIWGTNKTSTNSVDSHTGAIGGVHLTGVMILFPHSEFIQLAGDVIGRTSIGVPICVDDVGGSRRCRAVLWLSSEGRVEALEAT